MKPWYNISATETIEGLKSDIDKGLTAEQIEKNRELYGGNSLVFTKPKQLWKIILSEISNVWSLFMIIFIVYNIYVEYYYISVLYFVGYIIIITFIIYYRKMAQGKATVLDKLNLFDVHVLREGKYETIKAEELVVGDIIIVDKGMYVPADMRIIKCNALKVNELSVTGNDYIGEKFAAKIRDKELSLEDLNNILFKGSVILSGEGLGVAVATGMDTEIGTIVKADEQYKNEDTVFKLIKRVLNIVTICLIVIYICCITIGVYRHKDIFALLRLCTPITLGALPIITVIEALLLIKNFINYNNKKNIYINNLAILEKLHNIKSIFLEKKGVLTYEEYVVSRIMIDSKMISINNSKTFNVEKTYGNNRNHKYSISNIDKSETLNRLISIAMLCNDVNFNDVDNTYNGDDKEIGILKFIQIAFEHTLKSKSKNQRIFVLPIDGSKMIKTSVNMINRRFRANIIGPFDNILDCCTHILKDGLEVELNTSEVGFLKESAYDINIRGMEVFAIAYRNFKYRPSEKENILSNLILVGLIGMENPIKESTYELRNILSTLGMDSVIFTQENKLSLKHFGEVTNIIPSYSNVYSGVELRYMTSVEIKNIINHETIFSNLSEDQKVAIVNEHKMNRGIVCAIASRLIAVPHLSQADIPISFGRRASSIVRKISNIHFDCIDVEIFFKFIFESTEVVRTYRTLLAQAIQYSISMTIPILLGIIINRYSVIRVADLMYLEAIVIGISGISFIINDRRGASNEQEINHHNKNVDIHYHLSKYINKGIVCGIASYVVYWYFSSKKGIIIGNNAFFIVMGVLYSVSSLFNIRSQGYKRSLSMYLLLFLNLALLIAYIMIEFWI